MRRSVVLLRSCDSSPSTLAPDFTSSRNFLNWRGGDAVEEQGRGVLDERVDPILKQADPGRDLIVERLDLVARSLLVLVQPAFELDDPPQSVVGVGATVDDR